LFKVFKKNKIAATTIYVWYNYEVGEVKIKSAHHKTETEGNNSEALLGLL
jgi:hypothetical protein